MSGATQNHDGSKKRWKHGKAVVVGEVRYTSVSALELAHSCLRRWRYRYVEGIKDEEDDDPDSPLNRGNRCHAELAEYLTTGNRSKLSSIPLAGVHLLPKPDLVANDLVVEFDIVPDLPDGKSGLAQAKLRAGGIPLVGAIDLMHKREGNCGVSDIMDMKDPPGVLKLEDHKFPNTLNNIKGKNDLVKTLQMAGYAKWGFETFGPGNLEQVRLSHNYFPVRGNPLKVTTLVDREQVENTWKLADAIAVSIRDAAKEATPDRVDFNTRACRAYNRDCPAKSVCKATSHNSLSSIFGVTAADRLVQTLEPKIHLPVFPQEQMTPSPNSLVAKLKAQNMTPDARTVNPGQLVTYQPTVESEMKRLKDQEATATGSVEQELAELRQVKELVDAIESYGLGSPEYVGNAYMVICQAKGYSSTPGSGLLGSGELGQFRIDDPAMLAQVLAEVKQIAAQRASVPVASNTVAILPPDAPPSNPVLASKPPEAEKPAPKKRGRKAKVEPIKEEVASRGEEVVTEIANQVAQVFETYKQAEDTGVGTGQTVVVTIPKMDLSEVPTTQVERLHFYVDCIPDGVTTQSFWPIVHQLTDMLAKEDNAPDIRAGHKLDFGKWEGALAAYLKEAHRTGMIKAEHYLFESGSRFAQVVIETMREVVYKAGGVFIRGIK